MILKLSIREIIKLTTCCLGFLLFFLFLFVGCCFGFSLLCFFVVGFAEAGGREPGYFSGFGGEEAFGLAGFAGATEDSGDDLDAA
jgi:hypothetical protein